MANSYNTISINGEYTRREFVAGGTILPGYLLAINSSGYVIAHATSGGKAAPMFAVEDALQGKTIDDSYTSTNPVQCNVFQSGATVYAYIESGENIAKGDLLVSNGTGTLREANNSGDVSGNCVAVALEAIDLTQSGDVDTRIKVMIL